MFWTITGSVLFIFGLRVGGCLVGDPARDYDQPRP